MSEAKQTECKRRTKAIRNGNKRLVIQTQLMALLEGNHSNMRLLGRMFNNELIFRKCGGQVIVSAKPVTAKNPTKAQALQRTRFKEAVAYAKALMADPETRTKYALIAVELNLPNAYNVAVREYLANDNIKP